jgi:hypothetical protein
LALVSFSLIGIEKAEGKEVAEEESAGAEELIWWSNGRRITPMVDGIEEVALLPCELD